MHHFLLFLSPLPAFPVSLPKSFDDAELWRKEFVQQAGISDSSSFPFVLIGTKTDLESKVNPRRAEEYCSSHGFAQHVLTSAKDGRGVDVVFKVVAEAALRRATRDSPFVSSFFSPFCFLLYLKPTGGEKTQDIHATTYC